MDLTAALDERCEVAYDEGIEGNADQHPYERENDLRVGEGRDVAVADSRNGLSGPVERPDVVVDAIATVDADAENPGVLAKIAEFCC